MAVAFAVADIDMYTFGLAEADLTLIEIRRALENMHEPLEQIIRDMERHTLAQFESRGWESGDPWAALDPSTVAEKERHGAPFPDWPLVDTGAMMESATSPVGPYSEGATLRSEAWMGVDWERDGWQIPALHQEGVPWELVHRRAYVTRDGRHIPATSYMWHLPARPIFTLTDTLVEEAEDQIVAHIFNPLA